LTLSHCVHISVVLNNLIKYICSWQNLTIICSPSGKFAERAKKGVGYRHAIYTVRCIANTRWNLSIVTFSEPAKTAYSNRCVTTWMHEQEWLLMLDPVTAESVEADVASRSYVLTVETCLSRLKSDRIITPSKRTWSRAAIESGPSCTTGRQQPSWERQYLDPTQSSSILSVLSLSRFADIQWPTSAISLHRSSWAAANVVSVRRQSRYNCVSANACRDTPCFSAMSARSAVYTMNNSGPNTDPCGTEQTMMDDVYSYQKWHGMFCRTDMIGNITNLNFNRTTRETFTYLRERTFFVRYGY